MTTETEMVVSGIRAQKVAEVLNKSNTKILNLVKAEPLSVSVLAKRLGISEAYVSESVKALEDLKIVAIKYERGKRGICKIVSCSIEKITLIIKEEETT